MFWQDRSKLIQRAFDIYIRLWYDLDISFGLLGEDIFRIINCCLLRKYIFDSRLNKNIVSIDRFISNLKNRLEVKSLYHR